MGVWHGHLAWAWASAMGIWHGHACCMHAYCCTRSARAHPRAPPLRASPSPCRQPLKELAPYRPPASALSPSVLLSIVLQFCTHLHTLMAGLELAEVQGGPASLEADAEFEPSLLNTVVYLLSSQVRFINWLACFIN